MEGGEPVATLRFSGKRYDIHALDRVALREAARFLELVEDAATLLWRRAYPGRANPTGDYLESTRLYALPVRRGSAEVPFFTRVHEGTQLELSGDLSRDDEPDVTDALEILYRAYNSSGSDASNLDTIPAEFLGKLASFGSHLPDGTGCKLMVRGRKATTIDEDVRGRLRLASKVQYTDRVVVSGGVTRVNLKTKECGITTADGLQLVVHFSPRHESTITTALHDHRTSRIRITGTGRFERTGNLKELVEMSQVELVPLIKMEVPQPPAASVLDRYLSGLNAEGWSQLPSDLAENLDEYIVNGSGNE